MTSSNAIGFIGLGTMGAPMALNLVRAGASLMVWNRSQERSAPLADAGAMVAVDVSEVFSRCQTVVLMMSDERATDAVLARGTSNFHSRVCGRRIVAMGTMSTRYSTTLQEDIHAAGGRYVEAPVSGSRKPAEAGQLVAMLAGIAEDVAAVKPLLKPLCREMFECGHVPAALQMKLAVNVFLIALVTGLAEAVHFAQSIGLSLERFAEIIDAGPMASDVSVVKVSKLVRRDFERQAAISDVLKNTRLVIDAVHENGSNSPLMEVCLALYRETEELGLGGNDMIAVIRAIEKRESPMLAR
jgi:3-hydroxyisobutyrate dehydrogenase